jgi:hypothetical protein
MRPELVLNPSRKQNLMFLETKFLVLASTTIAIELAVLIFLYYMSRLRQKAEVGLTPSRCGRVIGKIAVAALPVLLLVAVIGDVATMKAWGDARRIEIVAEARAVEYAPLVKAAISAKPNMFCSTNGYTAMDDASTSKRACAQVGSFRVIDQYAAMPGILEIYKVYDDGTVRAAAYKKDWDTGFIADESVTTLAELKQAFNVK